MKNGNKTALYARFSSDNQRSESIDAQIRAMTAHCAQHGLIIVETYIDEAKSATTDKRPSFQQMITDSGSQQFDIVLVHKLDRFARNRYDSAVYKRQLKKNGVTVYSVLENLDDSPESIMMESVLEGMSEYYSQNLAREVMKGMRETALQGKHTGGKPPLGYDVDKETQRLVINEYEAETVKLIFDMYLNGYGYGTISAHLNKLGRKTKSGLDFNKNSLSGILRNVKYTGLYVFNRASSRTANGTRNSHKYKATDEQIIIEGGIPQIIDKQSFEKVQMIIKSNLHTGCKDNSKEYYLLSGKIYCMDCGKAMSGYYCFSGRNKDKYVGYKCTSPSYNCRNRAINRDYIETCVVELMQREIFNAKALKAIEKRIAKHSTNGDSNTKHRLDELETVIAETNEALQNVADAVSKGLVSATLTERLCELEDTKRTLEAEKTQLLLQSKVDPQQIDTETILSEYKELAKQPHSLKYKMFIQEYIDRITLGRYDVVIRLKTGLGRFTCLDSEYTISRKSIYERGKKR